MLKRPPLHDRDYRADRDAARAAGAGKRTYPALIVLGGEWYRLDGPGEVPVHQSPAEVAALCGLKAA